MLRDLELSGFMRVSTFYGKRKKDALYQLSDYYTAFYFRYIRDNRGKDEHFWSNAIDNPARRAWARLTFEQLCKDHIPQIKGKLSISGVLSEESIWYTSGDEDLGTAGAQIDLLIERRDRVINICEMKFSINEFAIDKSYDMRLRNKIESFRRATNCRQSLQTTKITTYGVKRGKYSGVIQSQVTLGDLFESWRPNELQRERSEADVDLGVLSWQDAFMLEPALNHATAPHAPSSTLSRYALPGWNERPRRGAFLFGRFAGARTGRSHGEALRSEHSEGCEPCRRQGGSPAAPTKLF